MNYLNLIKVQWIWWTCPIILGLFCLAYFYLENPEKLLNHLMIETIDVVLKVVPSTPNEFKLANIWKNIVTSYPFAPWGLVSEIIQGILGILSIQLSFKLIKYLPFF